MLCLIHELCLQAATSSAGLSLLSDMADLKSSDILQNLLGVDNSAIEQMLDSADVAAKLLDVQQ